MATLCNLDSRQYDSSTNRTVLLCQDAIFQYINVKDISKPYQNDMELDMNKRNKVPNNAEFSKENEPRLRNIMSIPSRLRRSSSDDQLYVQNFSKTIEISEDSNDKNQNFSPEINKSCQKLEKEPTLHSNIEVSFRNFNSKENKTNNISVKLHSSPYKKQGKSKPVFEESISFCAIQRERSYYL